ncbi:hypothetical protein LTS17_001629 [Exophiala oligosperma]
MDGPPDFRLLSTAFHNAGTEIDKLPKLPLIKHGDKFLALLEDMQREMTENFARMDEKFARIDEKFARIDENFARVDENFALVHQELGNLSTRITASDKNAVARNQNIHYCARSDQVLPLVNPLTCAPIPNFPTTINDIFRMNEQQTDSLMEQLNLQTGEGTSLAGKKAQIKMYIGVRSHVDKPAT